MREMAVGEPRYRFKYVGLRHRPVLQVLGYGEITDPNDFSTRTVRRWRDATPQEAEGLLRAATKRGELAAKWRHSEQLEGVPDEATKEAGTITVKLAKE